MNGKSPGSAPARGVRTPGSGSPIGAHPSPSTAFGGFPRGTLAFLRALSDHNDRDWFAANKARFEADVIEPALDFIAAMEQPLHAISPRFLAIPKRVGGSLFRIYRDTRFAHDKRPYKTNIGIQFRHDAARDVHAPGYYLHIGLDECFLGCGIWCPERPALNRIRTRIVERPAEWRRARRSIERDFALRGPSLKRRPPDVPVPDDHPCRDDLKRKDFATVRVFDPALLRRPDLCEFVAASFGQATPFMRFLCASQGARF